jgi:sodium-dependent phosphate transporter
MRGKFQAVGLLGGGGNYKALNWRMIGIIFFGWILTLPAAGLISGGIFYLLAHTTGPTPVPGNGFFGTKEMTR